MIHKNIIYIAHAMGNIDGISYTNSEKAFSKNWSLGFRFFEIDLDLTQDGEVILYHHSSPNTESEVPWRNKKAAEFYFRDITRHKYLDKYPILKLDDFLALLNSYPTATFILDIKSRRKKRVFIKKNEGEISFINAITLKYFPYFFNQNSFTLKYLKRHFNWTDSQRSYPHSDIIKQILYRIKDQNTLQRLIPQVDRHSASIVQNIYRFREKIWKPSDETIRQTLELANFHNCSYIALKTNDISDEVIQLCKENKIKLLAFDVIENSRIKNLIKRGVEGFFVDELPSDLNILED